MRSWLACTRTCSTALQIQKAYAELKKGSTTLGAARKQLLAVGGKGFKG